MNKTAWKVVRHIGNTKKYTSLNDHDYSLVYNNSWTTPKIGKIFVFRTREQARNFIRLRKSVSLKVERNVKIKKVLCRNLTQTCTNVAEWVWNIKEFWTEGYECPMLPAPTGTMFADAVKIVE